MENFAKLIHKSGSRHSDVKAESRTGWHSFDRACFHIRIFILLFFMSSLFGFYGKKPLLNNFDSDFFSFSPSFTVRNTQCSSKEKHSKSKNTDKSKGSTKETSLRERAVAKLKILNFNINWDVHMKPCGWVMWKFVCIFLCQSFFSPDVAIFSIVLFF